jgi:excisionase family DNA binding protein
MRILGVVMPNDAIEPNPPWVTARQIAERYSVTVPTVFNWLRAGIIPAKVAIGRVYRFDLAEVDAALDQRSDRLRRTPRTGSLPAPTPVAQPHPEARA